MQDDLRNQLLTQLRASAQSRSDMYGPSDTGGPVSVGRGGPRNLINLYAAPAPGPNPEMVSKLETQLQVRGRGLAVSGGIIDARTQHTG